MSAILVGVHCEAVHFYSVVQRAGDNRGEDPHIIKYISTEVMIGDQFVSLSYLTLLVVTNHRSDS